MPNEKSRSNEMSMNAHGGHLFMQTNGIQDCVIHYHRLTNGTLSEVERTATSGAGCGGFKQISAQESAPNVFEGMLKNQSK